MLAKRLREARQKTKMNQKEAASKAGISNVTLSQYEKGVRSPDPDNLAKLADVYNVSVDWLLSRFSSSRQGFGRDHRSKATKKYLELQLIDNPVDLPEEVRREIQTPVLLYRVLQQRDDVPVTISTSYLPNSLPLNEMRKILEGVKENPTLSLYRTLEFFYRKPISCEEEIIVDSPSLEEMDLLEMPGDVPVARITRKTFDASSKLVEYCLLTSRTDLYKFQYRFTL